MHPSLLLSLSLSTPILASSLHISPRQSSSEKTTLNDIDTLCSTNFSGDPKTIICMKDGTSTTFVTKTTSYLRNGDDAICCEADNICMLSSHDVPRASCYDPKTKRATIAQDGGPCELNAAGDGCKWTGTNRGTSGVFSTKGVTTVTAVQNGQAVVGGSGSGSGSSGSGSGGKSGASGVGASGLWGMLAVGVCALVWA